MSLTFNTKTYENDVARTPDIFRYTGPAHSMSSPDFLDLARTAPKASLNSAGVGKARSKLTRSATDGTDVVGEAIAETSFRLPVGMQESEQDALIADYRAWVATDQFAALVKEHDINH